MIAERILKPENVLCNVSARSKKHCLEILSEILASSSPGIPHDEVFEKLCERERLGSTGLGGGVAFPHCRFAGIEEANGALLKLSEAVEFESPDGVPVDLIFGLMVPEQITDSHREEIAYISRLLNDVAVQAHLRAASTTTELYDAFISVQQDPGRRAGALSVSRGT
jgi:PTS system nitrogen regulatory IIA component